MLLGSLGWCVSTLWFLVRQLLINATQIADDASRVEILIAATLVFVAGIFLIPNIDTFFGYK
jgi:hypothetical protein